MSRRRPPEKARFARARHRGTLAGALVWGDFALEGFPRGSWFDTAFRLVHIVDDVEKSAPGTASDRHSLSSWFVAPMEPDLRGNLPIVRIRTDGVVLALHGDGTSRSSRALAVRRAIPFALALRGHVILHAAAVEIDGKAVAFVGASGAGKSTLARELSRLGMRVLSDDLLRVEARTGKVSVPASARRGSAVRWIPLDRLFFLSRDVSAPSPVSSPLSRLDLLRQLVRNGFGEIASPGIWRAQFASYHRIALVASGFDLVLPDREAEIPTIALSVARLITSADREIPGMPPAMNP